MRKHSFVQFKLLIYLITTILTLGSPFSTFAQFGPQTDRPLLDNQLQERTRSITEVFRVFSGFQDVNLPEYVAIIIGTILAILAVAFIILIIYGGYTWMMARGNEENVDRAKSIIRHSIIGLIVLLSSYAIGYFVLYYLSTSGTGAGAPYGVN